MIKNKIIKAIGIYSLVLIVCTLSFPAVGFAKNLKNEAEKQEPKYNANKHNQTYGSLANSISEETEPDLILVQCKDGTLGYVKNIDLKEKDPQNPVEAVRMQKEKEKRVKQAKEKGLKSGKEIKVYDKDGESIIGEFFITEELPMADEFTQN